MESEALQGGLLKFVEDTKILCTNVETLFNWLANGSPPCAAYRSFMSGCLIALGKQPDVRPVGVRETWRCIFDKILLNITGPKATMECQDDHLCAGLKAGMMLQSTGFKLFETKS